MGKSVETRRLFFGDLMECGLQTFENQKRTHLPKAIQYLPDTLEKI